MLNRRRRYLLVPDTPASRTVVRDAIAAGYVAQRRLADVRVLADGRGLLKWDAGAVDRDDIPPGVIDWCQANGVRPLTHREVLIEIRRVQPPDDGGP